jgi:25S rRNA (uracil2634-N3)-methyltransferase
LSNQLLLLGFLQSAAKVLRIGPIPSVTGSARKKVKEDSDTDNGSNNEDDVENPNDVDEHQTLAMRGTVLITLRNVVPYTLWYEFVN